MSNTACNTTINRMFSILFMGKNKDVSSERVIDRALRLAKQRRQLNQSQFAKKMGVLPQHVTNWKRRGPDMPPEHYVNAADVIGCTVDELLGRIQYRLNAKEFVGVAESWIAEYQGLPEEQRGEIQEIVEDRINRFRARGRRNQRKSNGA